MNSRIFINISVRLWCCLYWTTTLAAEQPSSPVVVNEESDGQHDAYERFLYYEETKSYYPYDESNPSQGPCGEFMKLYKESSDSHNGVCLCQHVAKDCIGRPLLYFSETHRCYYAYEQGPCGNKEWLIEDDHGEPHCERNPCPPTKSPSFYFIYHDECYRTNTTAFCKGKERAFFIGGDPEPVCLKDEPMACFSGYSSPLSTPHQCPPNTKPQADGSCATVVSFG